MRPAVVVEAVRTPIGRASADKGIFRDVRADELSAGLLDALVERAGVPAAAVEDVRWGCVQQQGEQGIDVARVAVLMSDLPVETAGVTVNRNCASGLQALNDAAAAIMIDASDVQIAGGVEHMDHVPMTKDYNPHPQLFRRHSEAMMHMGLTAEYLARKYRIDRSAQDDFALRSHQLAASATDHGRFDAEIVPTLGRDDHGIKRPIGQDQGIRRDTSKEALLALPAAFNPAGGSVTAGNSSQVSVGAAALLVMSESAAAHHGKKPIAHVRAFTAVGVNPEEMGIGPVPAIQKLLKKANLKLDDIGCIEINEAFAVQVLSVMKLLGLDEKRVNTRGGAIALGHPLGASGARIAVTLLHRLQAEDARFGIAALCVGQGQGVATLFERSA